MFTLAAAVTLQLEEFIQLSEKHLGSEVLVIWLRLTLRENLPSSPNHRLDFLFLSLKVTL